MSILSFEYGLVSIVEAVQAKLKIATHSRVVHLE